MLFSVGMGELIVLLFIGGSTIFWVWMLIEAATKEPDGSQDRLIWVIIIVLTHFIGAAIYFFVRRPTRISTTGR